MSIRDQARPAIERGLAFLDAVVGADGWWPCIRYEDAKLTGPGELEKNPGMVSFGALALENCDHPLAQAIRSRSRTPALSHHAAARLVALLAADSARCGRYGIARWPSACVPCGYFCSNTERILSNRDAEGRF